MKKLKKRGEDGTVMVLVACLLVALLGFAAISVDVSVWYSQKRELQSAVDSGVKKAAEDLYQNSATITTALSDATQVLKDNNVTINQAYDSLTLVNENGKATLTLAKTVKTYFFTGTGATNGQIIKVSSSAMLGTDTQLVQESYPRNVAFDAASGINLTASNSGASSGSISTGGDIKITSYIKIDGDINCDGDLTIKAGNNYVMNGSILTGGNFETTSQLIVNGNVESVGKIVENSGGGTVTGDMKAGSTISLNGMTVKGEKIPNTTVNHIPYSWHWNDINNYMSAGNTATVTQDLYNSFLKDCFPSSPYSWSVGIVYSNGSISTYNTKNLQKLIDYIKQKTGKQNIYIDGSLTIQCSGETINNSGMIICKNDLNFNSGTLTVKGGTAFVSTQGSITTNMSNCTLYGALITLGTGKNIQLNNTGTIYGSVISNGTITDTLTWTIQTNDDWQAYLPPTTVTSTIKVTHVKLVAD